MTLRYVVPLLLWLTAIFLVSSIPNPPGAAGSDSRSQVAHVIEYAVLGFLAVRYARARFAGASMPVILAASWLFTVAYGISDEIHQSFVPRRQASIDDVLLDALGAVLGLLIWVAWRWLQRPRRALPA